MTLPRQTRFVDRHLQHRSAETKQRQGPGILASSSAAADPVVGCDSAKGHMTCGSLCCDPSKEYCSSGPTGKPLCLPFPLDSASNLPVFPKGVQVCFRPKKGDRMFCMMT